MISRLRFVALAGALLGGATFLMAQTTFVDDATIFQLEGDAKFSLPTPSTYTNTGDDWDCYFGILAIGCPKAGSAAKFTHETIVKQTTFTGGGSKDILGVSSWNWTNGSTPAKDDIQDGFAVAYHGVASNLPSLLIYFGADRLANNGDANIGFWFFQDKVSATTAPNFTGHHTDGDIFVEASFTNGGATSVVTVYDWECGTGGSGATCDSSGSLVQKSTTALRCDPTTANKTSCATTNLANTPTPWPYQSKSINAANMFPPESFFEGAVNVKALVPNESSGVCFASFLIETRSSQAGDAVLKDFVANQFEPCTGGLTNVCPGSTLNGAGTDFVYTFGGVVNNTGGALTGVTVTDVFQPSDGTNGVSNITPLGGPTSGTCGAADNTGKRTCTWNVGAMTAGQCKAWPSGEIVDCNTFLTIPGGVPQTFGTFTSKTNGGDLEDATLSANGGIVLVGTPVAPNPSCPPESAHPAISVTKFCSADFTNTASFQSLAVTVKINGTVCNQSADTDLTNITANDIQFKVSDNSQLLGPFDVTFAGGVTTVPSLAKCALGAGLCTTEAASCIDYTAALNSYTPSTASGGTSVATYVFDDKVTASGHFPIALDTINTPPTGVVSNSKTAECPLCVH